MWYYYTNKQQNGPISTEGIKDLFNKCVITRETLVWKEGMKTGAPLSETELASIVLSRSRPLSTPPTPLQHSYRDFSNAIKQGFPKGTLARNIALLLLFPAILSALLLLSFRSPNNDAVRSATRSAWNAMQQADFEVRGMQEDSQRWGKQATLYSQIDLHSVDQELIELIKTSISISNEMARISLSVESEIQKYNSNAVGATQLGMLFGGLLGNAQAGGALVSGIAAAGRNSAIDRIIAPHERRMEKLFSQAHELSEYRKVLAKRLSSRYKTTFIDP